MKSHLTYAGVVKKNRNRNRIKFTAIQRTYHFAELVDRFSQKISPEAGAYDKVWKYLLVNVDHREAHMLTQSLTDDGLKYAIICCTTEVDETVTNAIPSGSFNAADRSLATSPQSFCSSLL